MADESGTLTEKKNNKSYMDLSILGKKILNMVIIIRFKIC